MVEASGVSKEIEYKFLLKGLPPEVESDHGHDAFKILHGWIIGDQGVIKLRITQNTRDGCECWWAVKFGKGLSRMEAQETLPRDLFDSLYELTEGRRVAKIRYPVKDGEFIWEFDRFLDRDLVLLEVEVPTEDTQVVIPEWIKPFIVRDVTNEPEFLNVNLAK